jgi:hypothetical protein
MQRILLRSRGLRYVLTYSILSWLTLLLLLVNFVLPTASAQLVLFTKQWFAASDTQIGLLYASRSLGTVVFSSKRPGIPSTTMTFHRLSCVG